MTPRAESRWIVLKFGGTSVSTLANWRNIAHVVRKRLAEGDRILIVHSALSGITDRLENFLRAALAGTHLELLAGIEARHQALAAELGVGPSADLERYFAELRQIGAGPGADG
jgi:diaminopimelate decarboxylase/aspartate kinase